MPIALLVAVGFGALVGLFNATIVTKAGVNALVATLGTGSVLIGMNYIITSGRPLAITYLSFLIHRPWQGLVRHPQPGGHHGHRLPDLMDHPQPYGRGFPDAGRGRNAEAARMSGILNDRVKMLAYAISGMCAALAGMLLSSRLGSGQVAAGDGYRSTPSLPASWARPCCAMGSSTSWVRSSVRSR